ncbi:hypothetical protein CPC08DRAFT_725285 [Agrocybe pediades]|nr:hypothetical protein CPC08DRAFT_725285 [Agrocybe pediades]
MTTEVTTEPPQLQFQHVVVEGTSPTVAEEDRREERKDSSLSLEIPVNHSPGQPSPSTSSEPSSPNPLADSDILTQKNSSSETPPSSMSTHTASTSSLPPTNSTLSVKFAPLPQIAPRKRRSTAPLGMAARGQLMRRRRGHYADQNLEKERVAAANGMWTAEELEEQRIKQEAMAARYAQYQASAAARAAREEEARLEEEEEEAMEMERRNRDMDRLRRVRGPDAAEDRLLALRKTMKGLWKKVSNKDGELHREKHIEKTTKEEPAGGRMRRKSDISRHASAPSSPATASPTLSLPPVPPLPTSITNMLDKPSDSSSANDEKAESTQVDGAWEESIPSEVGQTETMIEGRPIRPSVITNVSSVEFPPASASKKEELKMVSILRTSSSPNIPKASRASLTSVQP